MSTLEEVDMMCFKNARLAIVCGAVIVVVFIAAVGGCVHRRDLIAAACMESERSAAECALIDCQLSAGVNSSSQCAVAYP